jgi:hypothetical protein
MTGTFELRIAPAMVRVESSSPPGVSSSISRARAPSELALAMAVQLTLRDRLDGVGETNLSTSGCCAEAVFLATLLSRRRWKNHYFFSPPLAPICR